MNELPFNDCFRVFVPPVVEAVNTHFNRAIALHVKDLQSPRNERVNVLESRRPHGQETRQTKVRATRFLTQLRIFSSGTPFPKGSATRPDIGDQSTQCSATNTFKENVQADYS